MATIMGITMNYFLKSSLGPVDIKVAVLRGSSNGHSPTLTIIGLASIMQLCMCVIKIVTFKGGHLMWHTTRREPSGSVVECLT